MSKATGSVTRLLKDWQEGETRAMEELMPVIYRQLRAIAQNQMKGQKRGHTLVPTALVHEVFLRLSQGDPQAWNNRSHFFVVAATCMRQILTDYARAKGAQKRGGGAIRVSFDEKVHHAGNSEMDLAELTQALERLEKQDGRLVKVVELRYLAGLSIEETAVVLGISPATVKRDWDMARAWLKRELESGRR
jgi:RNA polymerase sigma factor (TIGR02999 family)